METFLNNLTESMRTLLLAYSIIAAVLIVLCALVWGLYGLLRLFIKPEDDPMDMFMGGRKKEVK